MSLNRLPKDLFIHHILPCFSWSRILLLEPATFPIGLLIRRSNPLWMYIPIYVDHMAADLPTLHRSLPLGSWFICDMTLGRDQGTTSQVFANNQLIQCFLTVPVFLWMNRICRTHPRAKFHMIEKYNHSRDRYSFVNAHFQSLIKFMFHQSNDGLPSSKVPSVPSSSCSNHFKHIDIDLSGDIFSYKRSTGVIASGVKKWYGVSPERQFKFGDVKTCPFPNLETIILEHPSFYESLTDEQASSLAFFGRAKQLKCLILNVPEFDNIRGYVYHCRYLDQSVFTHLLSESLTTIGLQVGMFPPLSYSWSMYLDAMILRCPQASEVVIRCWSEKTDCEGIGVGRVFVQIVRLGLGLHNTNSSSTTLIQILHILTWASQKFPCLRTLDLENLGPSELSRLQTTYPLLQIRCLRVKSSELLNGFEL